MTMRVCLQFIQKKNVPQVPVRLRQQSSHVPHSTSDGEHTYPNVIIHIEMSHVGEGEVRVEWDKGSYGGHL